MKSTLKFALKFALALSHFVFASPSQAQINFMNKVDLSTKAEVQEITKIAQRVKTGDRSVCIGYAGRDMSGCAKIFIRSYRVHSAQAVRAMLDLTVVAAQYDRKRSGDRQAALMLADDYLTVVERVTPQRFFVQTIRAKNQRDRRAQLEVKRQENEALVRFSRVALPTVEAHLQKTQALKSNPRTFAWEESKQQELRSRINRLKGLRWKIADNS